jgi:hypothetical protein
MSEETKSISDYITELTEKATELQGELMDLEKQFNVKKEEFIKIQGAIEAFQIANSRGTPDIAVWLKLHRVIIVKYYGVCQVLTAPFFFGILWKWTKNLSIPTSTLDSGNKWITSKIFWRKSVKELPKMELYGPIKLWSKEDNTPVKGVLNLIIKDWDVRHVVVSWKQSGSLNVVNAHSISGKNEKRIRRIELLGMF